MRRMAGESWDDLNRPYSGGTLQPIKVKLSWEETMRVTSDELEKPTRPVVSWLRKRRTQSCEDLTLSEWHQGHALVTVDKCVCGCAAENWVPASGREGQFF